MARKTGPKPFKKTAARKKQVLELVSCGMSQDNIARALGCTRPTLVKHFAEELAIGLAKKRAGVIAQLFKVGAKGNVAALKKLLEMQQLAEAAEAAEQAGDTAKVASAKVAAGDGRLGKKKLAQIAATKVGGSGSEWGDDLDPDSLPN